MASYQQAVDYIAVHDRPRYDDNDLDLADYFSVGMVAKLFKKNKDEVARDVYAHRHPPIKQPRGKKRCSGCGRSDDTVYRRICAYHREVRDVDVYEVVCNDCEHEHRMNV